jgi:hypothetical protein
MKQGFIARLELRGEDPHFLHFTPGHALHLFFQEQLRPCRAGLLRETG